MAEKLTRAGADLLSYHQGNHSHCNVDKFILAYIPGQNPADAIDPERGLPAAEHIVHEQTVTKDGYLSPGMVVYSLYMDGSVGDFTFNTLYTVSTENNNTVMQIVTVPDTPKVAVDVGEGIRGQPMVRNLVMVYDDAAVITNVTVPADAWQFAFENATEEMPGLGEVATQEEVDAGEDNWRWVTPLTLANAVSKLVKQATETVKGVLRIGTQEEVLEGELVDVAVTPKTLWAALAGFVRTGQARFIGELVYCSTDEVPPGCFALDGSTIPDGVLDYEALANSGSQFISISGNNIVLKNAPDFIRGQGNSGRDVGEYQSDELKRHNHSYTRYSQLLHQSGSATKCWTGASTSYTGYRGGSETRPKSLTALICIYHGVI